MLSNGFEEDRILPRRTDCLKSFERTFGSKRFFIFTRGGYDI